MESGSNITTQETAPIVQNPLSALKQLSASLVEYLRKYHHLHTAIVITGNRVIMTEGVIGISFPFKD